MAASHDQERVAAAADALAASTTALDKARTQYEEVSDRVVREFARFRRDKASDMKKIILDYVNVQVIGLSIGRYIVIIIFPVVLDVYVVCMCCPYLFLPYSYDKSLLSNGSTRMGVTAA